MSEVDEPKGLFFSNETNCIVKDGLIVLADEINPETYRKFLFAFKHLESMSGNPIRILINSPGGEMPSMFSMYDVIRSSPNKVITIGTGEIASAAVLLLVCGQERYVTEHTVLMSHQGTFFSEGNVEAVREQAKYALWCEKRWAALMAKHTKNTEIYWKRITRNKSELWVLGGEAIVKRGLADAVWPNPIVDSMAKETFNIV